MKKLLLILAPVLLVACSDEVKPVDHYLSNIDEAKAVATACETKQGSKQDQNCINANKALYQNDMSKKFGGY